MRVRCVVATEEGALRVRLRHQRPRFTQQLPVGRYVLDRACRTGKLAVEIDGSQHFSSTSQDAEWAASLESLGWRVLRFGNSELREDQDGMAKAILAEVGVCREPTHPRPLPFREGS